MTSRRWMEEQQLALLHGQGAGKGPLLVIADGFAPLVLKRRSGRYTAVTSRQPRRSPSPSPNPAIFLLALQGHPVTRSDTPLSHFVRSHPHLSIGLRGCCEGGQWRGVDSGPEASKSLFLGRLFVSASYQSNRRRPSSAVRQPGCSRLHCCFTVPAGAVSFRIAGGLLFWQQAFQVVQFFQRSPLWSIPLIVHGGRCGCPRCVRPP